VDVGVAPYTVYPNAFSTGSCSFGSTKRCNKKSYAGYFEANSAFTDQTMLTAAGWYSSETAMACGMGILGPVPSTEAGRGQNCRVLGT
jgi:hypothetical protein